MSGGVNNYPSPEYNKLHRAVAQGSIKRTLAQLGFGVDINAVGKTDGETPLLMAAAQGKCAITELLLSRGADAERVISARQWTALFYAVLHPEVVKILLRYGANHGAKDTNGSTPLHVAIAGANGDAGQEVVEILLEFGADANAKDNVGDTPLHLLVHKGRWAKGRDEAAKVLIKYGANFDAVDGDGCTPLMRICIDVTGREAMAETLVGTRGKGADLDIANTFGSTSLHLLAAGDKVWGAEYIAMLLIEEGASIESVDSNGSTPLHIASMLAGNLRLVKILVKHGAELDAKDTHGETPLHLASSCPCLMIMSVCAHLCWRGNQRV